MKNTNKKILIIAIFLSLITTYISYNYLTKSEKTSEADEVITIIVAARDIQPRTKITAEMIAKIKVQKDNYMTNSIQNEEEILGKYSRDLILEGELIPKARLIEEKDMELALRIPEGKRAISISVNKVSGVADLIKVGDYIDIFLTMDEVSIDNGNTSTIYPQISKLFLQKSQVLAVDQELNRTESQRLEAPDRYTLTIAVSVDEAEKLTLAEDMGRIKIALRPQGDMKLHDTPGIIRGDLVPPKGARTISK